MDAIATRKSERINNNILLGGTMPQQPTRRELVIGSVRISPAGPVVDALPHILMSELGNESYFSRSKGR
jgi:hypothetical protein